MRTHQQTIIKKNLLDIKTWSEVKFQNQIP